MTIQLVDGVAFLPLCTLRGQLLCFVIYEPDFNSCIGNLRFNLCDLCWGSPVSIYKYGIYYTATEIDFDFKKTENTKFFLNRRLSLL